ncbi:MAG: ATP-binding protein [Pseudobdellovibrionaceae bacterium]
MSTSINQDLQASHQILSLIEQAKTRSETTLDQLPGIYLVFRKDGIIMRSNEMSSTILEMNPENIIGTSIQKFFKSHIWTIFQAKMEQVLLENKAQEFEVPVLFKGEELIFYFHLSVFDVKSWTGLPLFAVIGHDVSQLRRMQKQLSEIFATIPLGILTVANSGKIDTQISSYTEPLLGRVNLAGLTLEDVVFSGAREKFNLANVEAINSLNSVFGQPEMLFEAIHDNLPQMVELNINSDVRYIRLTYQPIVIDGNVDRLLVVLEDRTQIVLAQIREAESKQLEEVSVRRILQIKKCAPDILEVLMEDMNHSVSEVKAIAESMDVRKLANCLHGIKGNARVAGFDYIKDTCHVLETNILQNGEKSDWNDVGQKIDSVILEWKEFYSLYRALYQNPDQQQNKTIEMDEGRIKKIQELFNKYNNLMQIGKQSEIGLLGERISLALRSFNFLPLEKLQSSIEMKVKETADQLGKMVKLNCTWGQIQVDPAVMTSISNCLLHLLNNAIAHGIESPEVRLQNGKEEVGHILVHFKESIGMIEAEVSDDGAGLDQKRIIQKALKNKLITIHNYGNMPKNDAYQLIFAPGFSTAEVVNDIAGRGIGLDAVQGSLAELGGSISVSENFPSGTKFSFNFRSSETISLDKNCIPFAGLVKSIQKALLEVQEEEGFKIGFSGFLYESKNIPGGLFYGDLRKLNLALTTYVGNFVEVNGSILVDLDVNSVHGEVHVTLKKSISENEKPSTDTPKRSSRLEFSLPLRLCEQYIRYHNGDLEKLSDGSLVLKFGTFLGPNQIPAFEVGLQEGIDPKKAVGTRDRLLEVASASGIVLHFTDATSRLQLCSSIGEADLGFMLGGTKDVLLKQLLRVIEVDQL